MTLAFLDEVGFSLKGVVRQTWALRGHTPTVQMKASWDRVSMLGLITTGGQVLQHTHRGSISGSRVGCVLKHILRQVEGDVVIVLDNASIHKTKAVTAFVNSQLRLSLQYLPPYAPEHNPIERVWAYIKRNVLGNFCARTLPDLKIRLRAGWQRVRYIQLPTRLLYAYLPS